MKRVIFTILFAAAFGSTNAQVTFTNVTKASGIATPSTSSSSFTNSWADFDNDDYWDLFIARGDIGNNQVPQVYHNLRNGTFQDITSTSFPNMQPGYYAHMCFGDFDNDGFVDCYMDAFVSSTNKLWRNNGDLTFTDVSSKMLNPGGRTVGTVWIDYDEDGFIDLIVSAQAGQGTVSYHNNAGKTLDQINLFDNPQVGDIVMVADINQDGWPDLYVHNDFVSDLFLTDQSGVFQSFDNSFDVKDFGVHNRIAAAFADIDNDGYPDFMLAYDGIFAIWHNDSGKHFHNITDSIGLTDVKNGDHRMLFMQDVDNDGYLDLIVFKNLDSSEIWYGGPNGFKKTIAPFSPNTNQFPSSISWTDYDNDGFIDFFDASLGVTELWHNEGNANRWLNVKLKGHKANSMGIGSTVIAYSEGKPQYRPIGYYQSYYGYQPAMAHFGFGAAGCGSASAIDSVVVIWQPGGRQVIKNVRFNELAVIDQDSGIVRTIQRPISSTSGYAFPYFLTSQVVIPDTIVSVPLAVRLPDSFVQQKLFCNEISFGIGYNSSVIDISPSKVSARYTPPPGWVYSSSQMAPDSLLITISNSGSGTISDSLFLGTLRFDTYKSPSRGTYLSLDGLIIRASGNSYKFCHDLEGDFLGSVTVADRSAVSIDSSCPPLPNFNLSATPSLFNASTDIAFYIHDPGVMTLRIYDITGRLVRTLTSGSIGGGWHHYSWNGTSDDGAALASGFYTCIASGMGKADFVKIELVR